MMRHSESTRLDSMSTHVLGGGATLTTPNLSASKFGEALYAILSKSSVTLHHSNTLPSVKQFSTSDDGVFADSEPSRTMICVCHNADGVIHVESEKNSPVDRNHRSRGSPLLTSHMRGNICTFCTVNTERG